MAGRLMCFGDQRLQRFALGREPETVVNQFAVFRNEASLDLNHKAPLQPRGQVNRRDHAARTSTAKFNGGEFKRHESRVAA